MSPNPWAHFQIHRIDVPEAAVLHYRAFWRIDGQLTLVDVWSPAEWDRLPESERPRDARRLPRSGWMMLRPLGGSDGTRAEGPDPLSESLSLSLRSAADEGVGP